jgi:pSer/pThr/pTyr-binding forkhead associated (FHA) protein
VAKPTTCARCGRENDPGLAFCLDCGQALRPAASATAAVPTCSGCGAALPAGFRFCGACGKPAGDSPPRRAPPAAPPPAPGAADPARTLPPPLPRAAPPALAPGPRLRLTTVRTDGTPGASFELADDGVVCGRTEGAVRLAGDPTVSPRHARFTRSGAGLRVEDLGSVNGTFVRLRSPRRLGVGDELRVGRQLLRLEPQPPAPPREPAAARPWGSADPGCRLRLSQLLDGGGVGEVFPLREGENAVGRESGDVTFPSDRYVSSRHARLEVRGAEVTVSDAGSSNGTFVRIAGAAELAPGDQLLVGGQLLRLDA